MGKATEYGGRTAVGHGYCVVKWLYDHRDLTYGDSIPEQWFEYLEEMKVRGWDLVSYHVDPHMSPWGGEREATFRVDQQRGYRG